VTGLRRNPRVLLRGLGAPPAEAWRTRSIPSGMTISAAPKSI